MKEQAVSDMDRREFLSIVAILAGGALATALLPEKPPVEDAEATVDEHLWIGGY
jgi:hypothetical protein